MDSLTQAALGGALATAVLGRRAGWRAPLYGATLGTLPDLDVLVDLGGPVADFVYHRSFSHSLLVLSALSPLLAWLLGRLHPDLARPRRPLVFMVWLVLITHPLLDAFTIYGTQLFWPLDTTPLGLGSIFIIDPLYTLPLLVGVLAFLGLRDPRRALQANALGLILSTLYLFWTAGAQVWVRDLALRDLPVSESRVPRLLAQPTPFNSLLWRLLVMTDEGYRIAFYSFLDGSKTLHWRSFPSQSELLEPLESHWPVVKLQSFTHGFYRVRQEENLILISDLRMGLEPHYAFTFAVGQVLGHEVVPGAARRIEAPRQAERLPGLWRRLWQAPDAASAPGF